MQFVNLQHKRLLILINLLVRLRQVSRTGNAGRADVFGVVFDIHHRELKCAVVGNKFLPLVPHEVKLRNFEMHFSLEPCKPEPGIFDQR